MRSKNKQVQSTKRPVQLTASLILVNQRAICSYSKLYIQWLQFNNAAIVSKLNWKGSARKACSKGGKLKPSIQIFKALNTKAFFAVNKALIVKLRRFAAPLPIARRYNSI